jgi:hypothetical protein
MNDRKFDLRALAERAAVTSTLASQQQQHALALSATARRWKAVGRNVVSATYGLRPGQRSFASRIGWKSVSVGVESTRAVAKRRLMPPTA